MEGSELPKYHTCHSLIEPQIYHRLKHAPRERKKIEYDKFDELVANISISGRNIILDELEKKKHYDRHIVTDEVVISIPCLDFLDEIGKVNITTVVKDIQKISVTLNNTKTST